MCQGSVCRVILAPYEFIRTLLPRADFNYRRATRMLGSSDSYELVMKYHDACRHPSNSIATPKAQGSSSTWIELPSSWMETASGVFTVFCFAHPQSRPPQKALNDHTRHASLHRLERKMITSGSIFISDEDESGIKRWKDVLFWSPSRILDLSCSIARPRNVVR
jgi:hypothetical protein